MAPSETQIRSCWSMPRKNGALNDLHGSPLSPSQTIRPLLKSPLGNWTSCLFSIPSTQTSPFGVAMIPCISPRRPSKFMPRGGVSGLPLLSKTAMALLPYVVNQALSLESTAAPKVPPSIPPPVNPVVLGDSGWPFGANLVALPCHNLSLPCQLMLKLSTTQRLPLLSNMHLPPAR